MQGHINKGVIEILSSSFKLRNFELQHEDEIGNSTCIGSFIYVQEGIYIASSVWGYCFIYAVGNAKTWMTDKTRYILHTFFICTNQNYF